MQILLIQDLEDYIEYYELIFEPEDFIIFIDLFFLMCLFQ